MAFKIFPSIGIARVGNSPAEFFIGPETPASLGTELLADGTERPVQRFKDSAHRMKRQAARFRLFEVDDDGTARPASLPPGAQLRWTVELVNKKDAVIRGDVPAIENPGNPATPPLPTIDSTRTNRAIGASGSPSAFGQAPVRLTGSYLTGTTLEEPVLLGELTTDPLANLLVLGGHGTSKSPEARPIGNEPGGGGFYNNRGWYDDVSDGRVTATITLPGVNTPVVTTAWVIVAPPDFAPATSAVVTLYDVMFQAAVARQEVTAPARPSFSRDVWPMLRRAAGLADVNRRPIDGLPSYWAGFSTNWSELAKSTAASAQLRADTAKRLRDIGPKQALRNFSLRPWQSAVLTEWVNGNFESDFTGSLPDAGVLSPAVLTRTALDATAGQGFFPGIEGGIVVTNKTIYSEPFRIGGHVNPGDLTALMALPWQADFLECASNWWPSQRPDVAAQKDNPASFRAWVRPIDPDDGHRDLVANFGRLGVVAPVTTGGQTVVAEVERDPNF
jgi:L-Lysine epsilon oxidase N-terminal/L-lysine epsilon oxidase C-terminal domain